MSKIFHELWQELCGGTAPYRVLWLLPPVATMAICSLLFVVLPMVVTALQPSPRQPLAVRLVTTVPTDRNTVQSADQAANTLLATSTPIASTPSVASMVEHSVRDGETLIAILRTHCRERDYRQIAADNGIDPNRIYAGRTVLRFQSGCAGTAVVEKIQSATLVVVSSASQGKRQPAAREARAVPSQQAPVASVSPQPMTFLAEGCESGLAHGYVGTGRARRSLSDREILGCIDRVYGQDISEASELTGLPVDLLTAKVFVESRGRKDARHPDGSVGLSQLQPETARGYGVPPNRLHDPELNIFTGARVLADYVQRAGGNTSLGLVYYNAGPNRQFHRRPGFQPEHFPFVQRVARARALLAQ